LRTIPIDNHSDSVTNLKNTAFFGASHARNILDKTRTGGDPLAYLFEATRRPSIFDARVPLPETPVHNHSALNSPHARGCNTFPNL
jgi:hypothetical protein